jgi:hypothetical protein
MATDTVPFERASAENVESTISSIKKMLLIEPVRKTIFAPISRP